MLFGYTDTTRSGKFHSDDTMLLSWPQRLVNIENSFDLATWKLSLSYYEQKQVIRAYRKQTGETSDDGCSGCIATWKNKREFAVLTKY